jgi:hypothetical protein
MLKGFEEDLADLDLPDEVKVQLVEAANKRATGLASKNEELLGKLSSTKTQVKESQSAAEKLAAMEALQAQKELEAKQNYDDALGMVKTQSQKQIDELAAKVADFETKERNTLIGKGINGALTEARVNPLHQELVSTYFKQQAQLVDGKVMIGDKSLSEAITEWADTDQGKSVRLAPDNSGGNASGGLTSRQGSGSNMTESEKRAAAINLRLNKV